MHVDSALWFKPKINSKRLKELSKRSDLPGLVHFVIYFSSLIFFGYLSYVYWGTWLFLLFFFIYSTIYTFSIANGHETVHRTAFKTRWINEVFCYISFFQLHNIAFESVRMNLSFLIVLLFVWRFSYALTPLISIHQYLCPVNVFQMDCLKWTPSQGQFFS